jgi:hypothetical protein
LLRYALSFRSGRETTHIRGPGADSPAPGPFLFGVRKTARRAYLGPMFTFEFCLPTLGKSVPAGPEWSHEIKYDGYRLRLECDERGRHCTEQARLWAGCGSTARRASVQRCAAVEHPTSR